LTSDDADFFLEEALLSITSLRLQVPAAFVSLLTDTATEANLTGKRSTIRSIVNELVSVNIEKYSDKKICSRYLKTSMRHHVKGDFIYMDTDSVITEDISSLFETNVNLGAVLDQHACLHDIKKNEPIAFKWLYDLHIQLGFNSFFNTNTYFNSGMMLCKDSPVSHELFEEWHRLWLLCVEKEVFTDQQSLNQANCNLGNVIMELGGEWNCQIMAKGSARYLSTAKIIHYYDLHWKKNPYLLSYQDIHIKTKETGFIPQEVKDMLACPKSLFSPNTQLQLFEKNLLEVDDATLVFYKSSVYALAKRIYQTKIGFVFERCLNFIRKRKK